MTHVTGVGPNRRRGRLRRAAACGARVLAGVVGRSGLGGTIRWPNASALILHPVVAEGTRSAILPAGIRRVVASAVIAPIVFSAALGLGAALVVASAGPPSLTVQITSPRGRTGLPGAVRIVAQVRAPEGVKVVSVRFFVDGALLKTVDNGPPFAVEWADENPFERRHIAVEAEDANGNAARDEVDLQPFEVTEITEVTSVLLEAGVYYDDGRFVSGLVPAHFELFENGVKQEVQLVTQEQMPATLALLVDSSSSMSRRQDFVQHAAAAIVRYLRPKDSVIVAPFSKTLGAITGPTTDRATIAEAIAAITSKGGTAIYDAVVEMCRRLEGVKGRASIILITDAFDEHSTKTLDEALEALQTAKITAYVVEIGGVAGISTRGTRDLRALAERTGGRVFSPPREEDVAQVYDRLAADAQNRYLVTYTPTNQRRDGTWRKVELKTRPVEFKVRTREGYFAPQPPPVRPVVEFTAMDSNERYVEIAAGDLVVVEDGVEQKIDAFEEAVAPVSIVLVLDASGSMMKATPAVIEAARGFVKSLRAEDALGVMIFSDQAELVHDISTERLPVLQTIAQYLPTRGTALYDAICDALTRLTRQDGRRAVVVLTDGRDEDFAGTKPGSTRTADDVMKLERESGAVVFPVGIGLQVDRPVLEQMAQISGGRAFFPADVTQLAEEYRAILENLRRRYNIGYTSTNSTRDGAWRKVEIRAKSESVVIRSTGGYFAPNR